MCQYGRFGVCYGTWLLRRSKCVWRLTKLHLCVRSVVYDAVECGGWFDGLVRMAFGRGVIGWLMRCQGVAVVKKGRECHQERQRWTDIVDDVCA